MDTIMNMPIADRKFYIMMHNNTESGGGSERPNRETSGDPEDEKLKMLNSVKEWH